MKWLWIAIITLLLILFIAAIMGTITHNQCGTACEEKGATTFQRIPNGDWNMKDYCICYYTNSTETFQLGKKINGS